MLTIVALSCQSRAAATASGQDVTVEARNGLLTATFSDRTNDAALKATVPGLIAMGVEAINLRGTPVQDIRPLTAITGLKALDLRGTRVRDVTPLLDLTQLLSLNLQFVRISDLRLLSGMTGLRSLNLCGTDVRDLTPLATLTNLQDLVVSVTEVKDLTPLAPLRQLTSLDAGTTRIDDLRPLADMTNLRFLSLNGTAVADIQPLSRMQNLQRLDLGGTKVSDVRPLAGLRNLRTLDLESTQVADVAPLAGLTGLRSLSLGGSRVSDLSPLTNLPIASALGIERALVAADPVVFWNDQANRAIQATKTDAFQASRALALESIAVADTINSIHGAAAYWVRLPTPSDISEDVAVAAAAHAMLSHLFPQRQAALDAILTSDLALEPAKSSRREAIEFGRAVVDGVIAMRDHDGWNAPATIRRGTGIGEWRPTPPDFRPPQDPQWATMQTFALTVPGQFRPPGPPSVGSEAFRRALAAVASIGSADSSVRTVEQTEIARYWSDAIGTYAPAGHWNAIAATIVGSMGLGLAAEAGMFAQLNVAIADSAIAVADAKYTYWSWRPITAIRSGSDAVAAMPDWSPLLATPNHPGYISGHSASSGAAAVVLNKWFGSRPFIFTSASLPGVTRRFANFDQAAEDAAMSRVYGGIHFPFDNADGLATGRAVGAWTLAVFQRSGVDHGPFIMVDNPLDAGDRGLLKVTGCAFDNLAPLAKLKARMDNGPSFSVPVDARGLFALPPRSGSSGRHDLVLTATSVTGRASAVHLEIENDDAGDAVSVQVR
jgi:Leucine-rich repeat (LRR) protein